MQNEIEIDEEEYNACFGKIEMPFIFHAIDYMACMPMDNSHRIVVDNDPVDDSAEIYEFNKYMT